MDHTTNGITPFCCNLLKSTENCGSFDVMQAMDFDNLSFHCNVISEQTQFQHHELHYTSPYCFSISSDFSANINPNINMVKYME